MKSADDLSSLVSSRICHDLISPIGAIGNGLELLLMSHEASSFGPEFVLIQESVKKANSQISLYRIAFGKAASESSVSGIEIGRALNDCYGEGRVRVRQNLPTQIDRRSAKAALLGLMCLERALPRGGEIRLVFQEDRWTLRASGDIRTLSLEAITTTDPADIQNSLFPIAVKAAGRTLSVTKGDRETTISF